MRWCLFHTLALLALLCLLSSRNVDARKHDIVSGSESSHLLHRRLLQYISDEGRPNPIQAAKDVQALPYVSGNSSGKIDKDHQLAPDDSDAGQLPANALIPFVPTPDTNATDVGGWISIPPLDGFDLNRTWHVLPKVIMPFYSTAGLDATKIKRAVITFPGKPRDSWKYANLFRNALSVVQANLDAGVANGSVLIISPVWMNEQDQQAGGVLPNELVFHGSQWEAGGTSRSPVLPKKLTAYDIVDNFTDMLFDKKRYPALNQVVIAGHSMGGQATHRYAILKKQKKYDNNMSYWTANPGSFTYLSAKRPYANTSCTATIDEWHYGLGGNTTKVSPYARKDVIADKNAVVQRYLARKIHMSFGLLDMGQGDTHCEASTQGGSHLDRGSQYVLHLADVNGGTFPAAHTVDFIGNTSHQDFAMISADVSLNWLYINDFNVTYPDINASNPGDTYKYHPGRGPLRSYATHGNVILASSLLGGSLFLVVAFFVTLPFLFTANWEEEDENTDSAMKKRRKRNQQPSEKDIIRWHSRYLETIAMTGSPVSGSAEGPVLLWGKSERTTTSRGQSPESKMSRRSLQDGNNRVLKPVKMV